MAFTRHRGVRTYAQLVAHKCDGGYKLVHNNMNNHSRKPLVDFSALTHEVADKSISTRKVKEDTISKQKVCKFQNDLATTSKNEPLDSKDFYSDPTNISYPHTNYSYPHTGTVQEYNFYSIPFSNKYQVLNTEQALHVINTDQNKDIC